jgi:hypothetical protein
MSPGGVRAADGLDAVALAWSEKCETDHSQLHAMVQLAVDNHCATVSFTTCSSLDGRDLLESSDGY